MSENWKVSIPEGTKGSVEVRRFEIPEFSIENVRMQMHGRGATPGWFTGLYRNGALWMSDTDAEQRDLWACDAQIRRRGGRVLVMGLGLGMIVKRALSHENVEHVDVVEIDPDVAALVGPSYEGPRCTVHLGDAFEISWPRGTRWSVAWHDVWPDLCTDNLTEYARLARKYGRRADWQGFWGKELLRAEQRRDRSTRWGWGT